MKSQVSLIPSRLLSLFLFKLCISNKNSKTKPFCVFRERERAVNSETILKQRNYCETLRKLRILTKFSKQAEEGPNGHSVKDDIHSSVKLAFCIWDTIVQTF